MGTEVKLYGVCASPYNWRVVLALKQKGIEFEFIEEDLSNKSQMLLEYNPVHKKIPVLVHGGKPVCESIVILEYIEEKWPHNPLLPSDPYEKAVARFWLKFANDKFPAIIRMVLASGEEREEAIKETLEMLQTLEEHGLIREKKFFGDDKINMVDIAFSGIARYLEPIESYLGIKLLEADKFPNLLAWINNFKEVPIVKDTLPPLKPPQKKLD
ncbi:hypothetical protein JCGZ_12916 [Jatropha curcas]|uniref:glutathione transferase n=1 Tax=Jatropha curcas TaxID=180498 RepID=A0A067KB58_JATCU|nr:probable glutathione S-transferase [Jatropha curcas]KDP33367.1 hypothetical protein JCGZ_12916 [Jatropha curcas]